jgi:hypothetical protein
VHPIHVGDFAAFEPPTVLVDPAIRIESFACRVESPLPVDFLATPPTTSTTALFLRARAKRREKQTDCIPQSTGKVEGEANGLHTSEHSKEVGSLLLEDGVVARF